MLPLQFSYPSKHAGWLWYHRVFLLCFTVLLSLAVCALTYRLIAAPRFLQFPSKRNVGFYIGNNLIDRYPVFQWQSLNGKNPES